MHLRLLPIIVSTSLTCLATVAAAEPSATETDRDLPRVAITVSPLLAFVPLAEATVELRLAPRIGVAAIAGVGAFHDEDTNERVRLVEGGVSARYYVTGSFARGVQVGAEALYLHADTRASDVDIRGAGLSLAPFVGYKWTHRSGVTFEGQLGPAFVVARAAAESGERASDRRVGPMLNLQLGYSF